MLQDIREKSKGWLSYVVIGLIAVTFLIIGTGSFTLNQNKKILAKVDDVEISQLDVDHYAERYILSQGDQGRLLDTKDVKAMALEALIQDQAMMQASQTRGFRISKNQIIQAINQDPAFSQDGLFSPEKYKNLLSHHYYTDHEYRDYIASRFVYTQLQQGLVLTNFTLEEDLKTLFKFIDQSRDFEYAVINHKDYLKEVTVSDQEIKAYYEQHQDEFLSTEQVKVEYLELKEDNIKPSIQFTDEQINQHYLDNIQVFTEPDKYKVAHILLEIDDKDAKGEAKVKQDIESLKARISKGEDFGTLAKELSQDPVSAKKGGELLWIVKGQASVDPTFEEAVYKLEKAGDLSDPVLTPYGYHLIKLIEKEKASVTSFSEVKHKVQDMYTSQKAQEILYDKADELLSLSYEYSDTLENAADALSLDIKQTKFFGRDGGQEDITKQQPFLKAAFKEDVLIDGHNSELLEINKNHYVVLRALEHHKPEVIELEIVKENIQRTLTKTKASELAKAHASMLETKLASIPIAEYKKQSKEAWRKATGVNRSDRSVDLPISMKVFEMPFKGGQSVALTPLLDNNYAVIVLTAVKDGELTGVEPDRLEAMKESMSQNMGSLDFQLFAREVREHIKIVKEE